MLEDDPGVDKLLEKLAALEEEVSSLRADSARVRSLEASLAELKEANTQATGRLPYVSGTASVDARPGGRTGLVRRTDGGFQAEAGVPIVSKGACGADTVAIGAYEPVEFKIVSDVYWSGDCLYKEYWSVVFVGGSLRTINGPCTVCIVCATDCVELADPECEA